MTFERKTQAEEIDYQKGRRDGYESQPQTLKSSPAYKAGYRAGLLEQMENRGRTVPTAKAAAMQRRHRQRVQRDRTKYKRKPKHPKGGED